MNFDIVVTGFRNKGARMVVARHLVREKEITLPEALVLVDHLPVTLFHSQSRESVAMTLTRYGKLGIDVEAAAAAPIEAVKTASPEISIQSAELPRRQYHVPAPPPPVRTLPTAAPFKIALRRRPRNLLLVTAVLVLSGCLFFAVSRMMDKPAAVAGGLDTDHDVARSLPEPDNNGQERHHGESAAAATPPVMQNEKAQRYIDSAKESYNDPDAAVHFYKMAIAFNRRNSNAWYGLLDAYHRSGRSEEEASARVEMERVFGTSAGSLERILKPYGEVTKLERDDNGVLSVEYRTRSPAIRDRLLKETFLVARALAAECDCSSLSLFAATGASQGMVVHYQTGNGFASVAAFEKKAAIFFFPAERPPEPRGNKRHRDSGVRSR